MRVRFGDLSKRTGSTSAVIIYQYTHLFGAIFAIWNKLADHSRRLKPSPGLVEQRCTVECELEEDLRIYDQEWDKL
jgi:hypothetical protein